MKAQQYYDKVKGLYYETDCKSINIRQWDKLMKGAKRANKRLINYLVKRYLPELYHGLCLDFYNPYNYFRTEDHFIVVHSGIEYFLKIENE